MRKHLFFTLALLVALSSSVFAMGKGQTKIDFQYKQDALSSSRLFIKRALGKEVDQLPEVGSKSKNDNLANHTITLQIGSDSANLLTGVASDKGKVSTPFDCKLTGNGKGLQIKADGLDLAKLLGITQTTDGEFSVTAKVTITASRVDALTGSTIGVVLSDETVTFEFTIKKGSVKGRGF